jgi:type II secretory ATPase GspE/PulE/Tfp pilus assembly ATPase PilB-like protein
MVVVPVEKIVRHILIEAVKRRASDIFIEPLEDRLQVRLRIDGLLAQFNSFPLSFHPPIISRLKVISNLDISEHRLPQDGRFKLRLPNKEVDFRLSIMPSRLGEKAVSRILDKSGLILDINKLGLDSHSLDLLEKNLKSSYGIILVCGPTGCGKTTSLYACLKHIDSIEKNIITVEDPIEYQLHGINQVEANEEIGFTFANVLRSILRQDPNIILVGEMRDSETAEIAIRAALTGHLVLSTLHTTTATGALIRLINMGIEPFLISSSCLLVASQVLLRLFCPECKQEYKPPQTFLEEIKRCGLDLEEVPLVYQAKGCAKCNNSGYLGRTAVMEALPLSPAIKDMIERNLSEVEIRKKARAEGMLTLRQNALQLVLKGLTSIEEAVRLTAPE